MFRNIRHEDMMHGDLRRTSGGPLGDLWGTSGGPQEDLRGTGPLGDLRRTSGGPQEDLWGTSGGPPPHEAHSGLRKAGTSSFGPGAGPGAGPGPRRGCGVAGVGRVSSMTAGSAQRCGSEAVAMRGRSSGGGSSGGGSSGGGHQCVPSVTRQREAYSRTVGSGHVAITCNRYRDTTRIATALRRYRPHEAKGHVPMLMTSLNPRQTEHL
ncbi:hypothetical protein EYF80_060363 [Liparis tanakae]|uniref:Uncharacterized protein n=1 Tax=Liparis tanakae TaxID=230148 RepID=A0A4Z2EL77_9TELE|nr:hypothetical protein EYF80_060363 [Liparis tanakae]